MVMPRRCLPNEGRDVGIILGQKVPAFLYLFIWHFSGLSSACILHLTLTSIELTDHTRTTAVSWRLSHTMILQEEKKSTQSMRENLSNNQSRSYGPNFGLKSLNNRIKLLQLNYFEFRVECLWDCLLVSLMEYEVRWNLSEKDSIESPEERISYDVSNVFFLFLCFLCTEFKTRIAVLVSGLNGETFVYSVPFSNRLGSTTIDLPCSVTDRFDSRAPNFWNERWVIGRSTYRLNTKHWHNWNRNMRPIFPRFLLHWIELYSRW